MGLTGCSTRPSGKATTSCPVILRIVRSGRKRSGCATIRRMRISSWRLGIGLFVLLGLLVCRPSDAGAQDLYNFSATTEQSCSFGMDKGEPSHQCHVPIPAGCLVANMPGGNKPWTTVSKGGKTFCRFDEKHTDWKTKITGTCGRCTSSHCSVQFIVRFDCSPRQ